MADTSVIADRRIGQSVALRLAKYVGLVVAAIAAAYGITMFVFAAVGPDVPFPLRGGRMTPLPLELRLLLGFGTLLGAAVVVTVALAIAWLADRIRQSPGLGPDVTRTTRVIGVSLIAGPLAIQLVDNLSWQLVVAGFSDATFVIQWFVLPDLSVPAIGIAVILISIILRAGERLQRDLEGLV